MDFLIKVVSGENTKFRDDKKGWFSGLVSCRPDVNEYYYIELRK